VSARFSARDSFVLNSQVLYLIVKTLLHEWRHFNSQFFFTSLLFRFNGNNATPSVNITVKIYR